MKKVLILLFFISYYAAEAQVQDSVSYTNSVTYNISYFGYNLIKPGLKAGVNFNLRNRTIEKFTTKKSGKIIDKSGEGQWLAGSAVGFFWQPGHISVFNYYEISYKRLRSANQTFNIVGFGPGIYRSVYPETYEVGEDGQVQKKTLSGRTYFAPVVSFGSGKNINNPLFQSWQFCTNLMFLFDYNTGIVPLLSFELTFNFNQK